ncbi:hypothetical protein ABID82_007185 [Methylobacterium sp. PvP062]|uniref:Uncharacterized protein n=1 Tax=Methylobacterium radiotolerans TaxID=31998 RepID=A0ABV2NQH5_9HYPH|nr:MULTISPECIES: hypothetical protein [unclassified Methylobacterium]MBP2494694.1 hypothetical protein [Methylobacterium sp. PvP105]MBP2505435.1 hypothetical protein [Methylobacterium sp. PvP109]MCX7336358.1 hypothetical protein [Hyphomicrobiales bacterium]
MSSNRRVAWGAAFAKARGDRMVRREIREERLRGQRCSVLDLSAWRGQSGRRYVVAVYTLAQARADVDAPGAVLIGVRRGDDGLARIVGVGWRGTMSEAVELAAADGATEMHAHRLADSDEDREAIVEDLVGDDAL